jgi:hypothetical protein
MTRTGASGEDVATRIVTMAKDHTAKEISEKLGVNISTVRWRLRQEGVKAKSGSRSISDEMRDRIIAMAPTHTQREIAEKTGVNLNTLYGILKRAGVNPKAASDLLNDPIPNRIVELAAYHTVKEIAAETGVSVAWVYRVLRKRGVKPRSRLGHRIDHIAKSQIAEMAKTHTAKEIAIALSIGRATVYDQCREMGIKTAKDPNRGGVRPRKVTVVKPMEPRIIPTKDRRERVSESREAQEVAMVAFVNTAGAVAHEDAVGRIMQEHVEAEMGDYTRSLLEPASDDDEW